ncbi:MAG TPA: hypothetical protein VFO16_06105 [Pseudonocardiaceae bacterium]|nr:hypothetical protein [Pseudonocardiaceae bacterium]
MSDDHHIPVVPQVLWQTQVMDWFRVTFNDLYRRAQALEDLVRGASAVTSDEAGRSRVDLDSAAWSLAFAVANTPRPPLPSIPLDLDPQPHRGGQPS